LRDTTATTVQPPASSRHRRCRLWPMRPLPPWTSNRTELSCPKASGGPGRDKVRGWRAISGWRRS
jgi:hypothetical protein